MRIHWFRTENEPTGRLACTLSNVSLRFRRFAPILGRSSAAMAAWLLAFACSPMDGAENLGTSSSSSSGSTPIGPSSSSGASGVTPQPDGGEVPDSGAPAEDPTFLVKQDAVFVDNVAQRIVVMEPRTPASAKLPIIVAYHGDGQSAEVFRRDWGLHRISGQAALVVYADDSASSSAWGGAAMHVDHPFAVGFGKIIQRMTQVYDGDASRVFVAGLSSGAIFANLLGCKYSGSSAMSLRAAVIMSGSGPNEAQVNEKWATSNYPKCSGQKPLTTLVVHGKADATPGVSFAQGQWAADYWTYVNRVGAQPPVDAQANYGDAATSTPFAGFAAQCRKYDESPTDHPVVFCAVDGLGHALWPDSASTAWQFANFAAP